MVRMLARALTVETDAEYDVDMEINEYSELHPDAGTLCGHCRSAEHSKCDGTVTNGSGNKCMCWSDLHY